MALGNKGKAGEDGEGQGGSTRAVGGEGRADESALCARSVPDTVPQQGVMLDSSSNDSLRLSSA